MNFDAIKLSVQSLDEVVPVFPPRSSEMAGKCRQLHEETPVCVLAAKGKSYNS